MAFCGLCGKEISDGQTFCRECNNDLAYPQAKKQPVPQKAKGDPASIICFIAAGIIFLLCLFGGFQMLIGAENMSRLTSVSGNTVAEIFYNNCGTVFGGFGLFVIACGVFACTFLIYCGLKNIKK